MNLTEFVNNLDYNEFDYIGFLKKSGKKVFVYGADLTAKRKLAILRENGIEIEGLFVDDEYYEDNLVIDGIKVFKKSEVLQKYEKFNTVIGFYNYSRYLEVLHNSELTNRGEILYIPEVGWHMDKNFFADNVHKFQQTYDWLDDEQSKQVFLAYLKSRILSTPKYLCELATFPQYFDPCVKLSDNETFIDAGAYTGDTVAVFLEQIKNKFYKIYSFEADINNANILKDTYKNNDKIVAVAKGLWSQNTTLYFDAENTTSSKVSSQGENKIEVVTIDDFVKDVSSDVFLKADIEGSELEMLKGAKEFIKKHKPKMAICVYHKLDDLITIPQYIKSLNNDYNFYLRQHSDASCDETVLYAV